MNSDPECMSIDTLDNVSAVIEDAEADDIDFEIATPRCSIDSNFNSLNLLDDLPKGDVPTIVISETKTNSDPSTCSDGKSSPSQDEDTENVIESVESNIEDNDHIGTSIGTPSELESQSDIANNIDVDNESVNGQNVHIEFGDSAKVDGQNVHIEFEDSAKVDDNNDHIEFEDSAKVDGQNDHIEFEDLSKETKSNEETQDITLSFVDDSGEIKVGNDGIQLTQSVEFSGAIVQKSESIVEKTTENVKAEFTDLKNADARNPAQDIEDEEGIDLDNILMKERPDDDDSDFDFDFDLPSAPATQTAGTVTAGQAPAQISASQNSPKDLPEQRSESVISETKQADIRPFPVSSPVSSTPTAGAGEGGAPISPKPLAFVKPTPQVLGFSYPIEKKDPEPEKQNVLQAAQEEWDKVTTIQPGLEPAMVPTMPSISPRELTTVLMQQDFSKVKATIRPAVERRGFAAFINLLFGPPRLDRNLLTERDNVFCIAASQLDNENTSHIRTLQTIYRCLTGSKFDCPRMGSHWEEIGFQGSDPATDLRGAGLLGLLNLLYFLSDPKKQTLASDIYRLSLHPTQNFPFCVMGMNLTKITLQTLREELLNKECNRRGDIMSVVNEFYAGLYLQMYQVWKGQGKTISDSGYVIKDLELRAKKNSKGVLKNLDEYLNKKVTIIAEKTTDLGTDDFMNVCD